PELGCGPRCAEWRLIECQIFGRWAGLAGPSFLALSGFDSRGQAGAAAVIRDALLCARSGGPLVIAQEIDQRAQRRRRLAAARIIEKKASGGRHPMVEQRDETPAADIGQDEI